MIAYLLSVALQSTAIAAGAPQMPTPVAASNPDDKIVCREEEVVGTRLGGHKVCMTKAQWRENALVNRDELKHAQDDRGYAHN